MKKISVCPNHQDTRLTPLLYTFVFPGAEYWCSWCGYKCGMFSNTTVPVTDDLELIAETDRESAQEYLRSRGVLTASKIRLDDDTWVKPANAPPEFLERMKKVRESWVYPVNKSGD